MNYLQIAQGAFFDLAPAPIVAKPAANRRRPRYVPGPEHNIAPAHAIDDEEVEDGEDDPNPAPVARPRVPRNAVSAGRRGKCCVAVQAIVPWTWSEFQPPAGYDALAYPVPRAPFLNGPLQNRHDQIARGRRFDLDHTEGKNLALALKHHGIRIPVWSEANEESVEKLRRFLQYSWDGLEPYIEDFEETWESSRAAQLEREDQTLTDEQAERSGFREEVRYESIDLERDELAAFLYRKIINSNFCGKLRKRCLEKMNRPHVGRAAPVEDPIDPAQYDPRRRGDRSGDYDPGPNDAVDMPSDEEDDLEDDIVPANDDGDEADFGGDVNEFDAGEDDPHGDDLAGLGDQRAKAKIREICENDDLFRKWFDKYSALIFYDALQPTQKLESQWTDGDHLVFGTNRSTMVNYIMSRQQCRDFRSVLTIGTTPKHMRKFGDIFTDNVADVYVPGGRACLDDAGLPHKGPGPVIYNPCKPNEYSIKVIELVDDQHIVCFMRPDIVKGEYIKPLQAITIAHEFLQRFDLPQTVLIGDSWFGSLDAAKYLANEGRRFCLSLKNTAGNYLIKGLTTNLDERQARDIESKDEDVGEYVNRVAITSFRQVRTKKNLDRKGKKRKPITLISNILPSEFTEEKNRWKPAIVHFYAYNMGFVDHVDRCYLSLWRRRAYRSWKVKLIHFFIFIAMQNAWRWYCSLRNENVKLYEFCSMLGRGLLGEEKLAKMELKRIVDRLTPDFHCRPVYTNQRHLCVECRRSRTTILCACTNDPVHIHCRDDHHQRQREMAARRLAHNRLRAALNEVVGWVRGLFNNNE